MGRSLRTKLVYGYDLGGDEDGWKFEEYDEDAYQMRWPGWVELDGNDDEEPEDFITQAEERLVQVIAGFTEEWTADSGYYDRRNAAKTAAGLDILDFELYGTSAYTEWAFGIDLGSDCGIQAIDAEKVSPANLATYDDLLRRSLEALEVTPTGQPKPRLLALASYF